MFESRVMKTFGTKREPITKEDWRKLRNEEFHDVYFSPDIVQDEVGVVYDTYKGKRCVQGVGREASRKETN